MKFRRRVQVIESEPQQIEQPDGLDSMTLPELMAELAQLDQLIDGEQDQITEWFDLRRSGDLHDGEYNRRVSYLGQRVANAHEKKAEILRLIDQKNRELAQRALGA